MIRQLLLLLSLLLMAPAWGSSPSPVQHYFQDLRSLRANFIQRVFDERSQLLQSSAARC